MGYSKDVLIYARDHSAEFDSAISILDYDEIKRLVNGIEDFLQKKQLLRFFLDNVVDNWDEFLEIFYLGFSDHPELGSWQIAGWDMGPVPEEFQDLVWKQSFPDTVPYGFLDCVDLRSFICKKDNLECICKDAFYKASISRLELASCKKIEASAFCGCNNLSGTIVIPEGCESIERMAFAGCNNIKVLELPQSIKQLGENIVAYAGKSGWGKGKTKIKIRGLDKSQAAKWLRGVNFPFPDTYNDYANKLI